MCKAGQDTLQKTCQSDSTNRWFGQVLAWGGCGVFVYIADVCILGLILVSPHMWCWVKWYKAKWKSFNFQVVRLGQVQGDGILMQDMTVSNAVAMASIVQQKSD